MKDQLDIARTLITGGLLGTLAALYKLITPEVSNEAFLVFAAISASTIWVGVRLREVVIESFDAMEKLP
ncbi:MAG: hypothetical protein CFR70_05395 [Rhodocyclaceae bacterium]|nr:MAG: hypothetical protein CFR70_05395 [Rhodocyclaceae bacterium]